jgi:hypothetical protein
LPQFRQMSTQIYRKLKFQALGDFFYYGFDRQGWAIHMLFFSLGGIL